MLTDYIQAGMSKAIYEVLDEDGSIYGSIPDCPGVWASEDNELDCSKALRSALEGWVLLGIYMHHELPIIDNIDINLVMRLEAA